MPGGGYNLGQATGRLVIDYDGRGIKSARQDITGLGRDAQKTGSSSKKSFDQVSKGAGTIGVAAAAGLAAIIGVTAKFDKQMSAVAAATMAPADELEKLRTAAINAGAQTAFSASEAAQGIEELAKAGVSTADILSGGLSGALDLAAAGSLGVGDAAEIAASALTQFHLKGTDVAHVADLLAAGAGKAQGSVQDMGFALKYAGVPANALGVSIEETTGVIGEFASAGIVGEQAGTTLRSMLLSLAAPTKQARDVMKGLGLEMYDEQGHFIGMQAAAEQLKTRLGPLTEAERNHALSVIFGQTAIQGAITLYNGGGKAVDDWTKKVNDSGYAQDTAAKKLDNFSGDLEAFKGSVETAFIGAGEGATGPARQIVQSLTGIVNAYNKVPGPVKAAGTALLAITAILGSGIWATSRVVRTIDATRTSMANLGLQGPRTARAVDLGSKALRGLGIAAVGLGALTIVAAGIKAIGDAMQESLPGTEGLTKQLLDLKSGKIDELSKQFNDLDEAIRRTTDKSSAEKFGDTMQKPFEGLFGKAGSLEEAEAEINAIDAALANLASSGGSDVAAQAFDSLAKSSGLSADEIEALRSKLPQFKEALAGNANQATLAADGTSKFGDAAGAAGDAAGGAATDIAKMTKAMEDERNAAIKAFDAETAWRQALKDAKEQADSNSVGIKGNSDAALKNRSALSGLASAWNSQGDAVRNNVGRYNQARDAFIKMAVGMGVSEDAARRLADAEFDIPEKIITKFGTDDAGAIARAKKVQALYDSFPPTIQTAIKTEGIPTTMKQVNALVKQYGLTEKQRTALVSLKDLASKDIGNVLERLGILDRTKATPGAAVADHATPKINSLLSGMDLLNRTKADPKVTAIDHATPTIDNVLSGLAALRDKTVTVTTLQVRRGASGAPANKSASDVTRARGGLVRGPGGPTGDKINARLSDFEYVQRSAAVRYYGVDLMNALNRMQIPKKRLQGFAGGGLYRSDPASMMAQMSKAAMNTNVSVVAPVFDSGSGAAAQAPSPSALGVSGTLELRGSRAYIAGIAQEVYDDNDDHANTMSRMSGRR